jgi:histidine ammonia-lyase
VKPFDERLAELQGPRGHRRTAENVRRCLARSAVLASHVDCDRVQDPYSLRCVPQIHGAFKTALEHVQGVLATELNSVTDNPIVFPDTREVVSAGQFHGQPLSIPLDYLAIALATLANVSERRIEQLVNPDLSHLPAFLTPKPGLNSGLMIAQGRRRGAGEREQEPGPSRQRRHDPDQCEPGRPRLDGRHRRAQGARDRREPRVRPGDRMGWCAAQAREFHKDLKQAKAPEAAYALLRTKVKPLGRDRFLHTDIVAAKELLVSGRAGDGRSRRPSARSRPERSAHVAAPRQAARHEEVEHDPRPLSAAR